MTEKIKDIMSLKCSLIDCVKSKCADGLREVDTHEASMVVDMIKDLADAEKNCMEAKYYKTVIEAMQARPFDMEDEEENERRGYNHNRYASGRFAPSGHGNFAPGYHDRKLEDYEMMNRMMGNMGYTDGRRMGNMNTRNGYDGRSNGDNGDYGYHPMTTYEMYREANRHYNETHSDSDKMDMNEKAKHHILEASNNIRTMYVESDPELRKKIKADLTKLVSEMN